ncbi:MAG: MBL fold metallo-hydrolase [Verrucomicrobiales bacterium]|nr:MBL fold metallo-hydrolase [Verrucomicrobiales bacterium]
MKLAIHALLIGTLLFSLPLPTSAEPDLPEGLRIEYGILNRIEITSRGARLAINASIEAAPDLLLLTHARRDIIEAAKASDPAEVLASSRSERFLNAETLWSTWWEDRFDYYGQQVRQWPLENFAVDQLLPVANENQRPQLFDWKGIEIEPIDTPGYTRDGICYLIELQGQRVCFVGDIVLAGGKVQDLYSFQDEIRPGKIGAYHGYLGRISRWISSLERIAKAKPDILIPSRGIISHDPEKDIRIAIQRAREIYRNYLSTNALHWYFGPERMNTCAELVLGKDHGLVAPKNSQHIDLPTWCKHIGTTKLLLSESNEAFVLDVGGQTSLKTLETLVEQGAIAGIEGIFATHTHNDHTAAIAAAAEAFQCPVYALPEVADVLSSPSEWFLPGVSPHQVEDVIVMPDQEKLHWKEFTFTFRFFPGQMYRHGALLVERRDHDPVFFIGDSFSPTGIDDYCMMNRNLHREDTGYLSCFKIVQQLPPETWLVNQHIPYLFRYNEARWKSIESAYRERIRLISEFCEVEDPNFAIDEQWARFHPYTQEISEQGEVQTSLLLENHATESQEFTVSIRDGSTKLATRTVEIAARGSSRLDFKIRLPDLREPMSVLTADIQRSSGHSRVGHCETLIRLKQEE